MLPVLQLFVQLARCLWSLDVASSTREKTAVHLWDSIYRTALLAPSPIDTAAIMLKWYQGYSTYLRTPTHTCRHTQHIYLSLVNVIKRCSDTAWYWLWWSEGTLALCCCLTYDGSFRGCLTGCYKMKNLLTEKYASSPSAPATITKEGVSGSLKSTPDTFKLYKPVPANRMGFFKIRFSFYFHNSTFLAYFFKWRAESSGYCTAPRQSCAQVLSDEEKLRMESEKVNKNLYDNKLHHW